MRWVSSSPINTSSSPSFRDQQLSSEKPEALIKKKNPLSNLCQNFQTENSSSTPATTPEKFSVNTP
jgi:hypothetical protein